MKKIGILGGLGPASTVEYYRSIINGYRKIKNDGSYPHLFINSINMMEVLHYVASFDYEKLINLLLTGIKELETIGADYVAIASNTPHIVIDELIGKSTVPLISIVEETCKYAKNENVKKVLFTGTMFTMNNNFYKKSLAKYNIECITPDDNEKAVIHNVIFPNLENGIIIKKDKHVLKDLFNKIIRERNIDGIILGCTELPLILNSNDFDICVLDTMDIHVKSILEKMK